MGEKETALGGCGNINSKQHIKFIGNLLLKFTAIDWMDEAMKGFRKPIRPAENMANQKVCLNSRDTS